MNWPLFILVFGACLIYDITALPTSDVTEPKTEENSREDPLKFWETKPTLCEQCLIAIFGLTFTLPGELPYERLQYYTMTADDIKESCHHPKGMDVLLSDFCALIDGKEFEFVKEMLDCTGLKFKESKIQPNCTVSGSNDEPTTGENNELKVCDSYVENCKFDQLTRPTEVPEV
ncbi:hypothetical protein Ddc_17020 [Ditylenchus destructor]|nr:hypothetical protein Ddc_17020 [Ditylenchus destructor]